MATEPIVTEADSLRSDAEEYEQKYLATAKLLEESEQRWGGAVAAGAQLLEQEKVRSELLDRKLGMAMAELGQYVKDLQMFRTAHGSDYAARRHGEVIEKINQIQAVK
jgi:hypothetical protein